MKTFSKIIICLILIINAAIAVEPLKFEDIQTEQDKLLGYIYQQPYQMQDDPVGDMLLLETVKKLPKSLISQLRGKYSEVFKNRHQIYSELRIKFPDHTVQLQEELNYDLTDLKDKKETFKVAVEGNKKPFRLKKAKRMFLQVIAEEHRNGITPSYGKPHTWSKEFKKKTKGKYILYKRFSKVFLCLVRGVCSRFIVSDQEDNLVQYILEQDYESITLDQLFRQSYRLNNGDVYLTLLTIENVLSRYWNVPNRKNLAITKRLKPFSNFHYETDIFGQWYHLFGIMLYGYTEGSVKSTFVGAFEGLGSLILSGFKPERQENAINTQGGKIGAFLKRAVKRKKYENFEFDQSNLLEKVYLRVQDMKRRIKKKKKKLLRKAKRRKRRNKKEEKKQDKEL